LEGFKKLNKAQRILAKVIMTMKRPIYGKQGHYNIVILIQINLRYDYYVYL